MTNEALDALARRANDAGFPTIPEYAVALEAELDRMITMTVGLSGPRVPDLFDRALAANAVQSCRRLLGDSGSVDAAEAGKGRS